MLFSAEIFEVSSDYAATHFVGECDQIEIKTNVRELQGELVQFYGESASDVSGQIIAHLKSKGLTGKLRVKRVAA